MPDIIVVRGLSSLGYIGEMTIENWRAPGRKYSQCNLVMLDAALKLVPLIIL